MNRAVFKKIFLYALCCVCLALPVACSGNSVEDLRAEGQKLLNEGNAGGAVVFFKNALERDPADFASRLNLARAYVKLGKFDQADDEMQKCLRQNPDDRELNIEMATMNLARNKVADALTNVQKAEAVARPDAVSREIAGIALSLLGRYREAESALQASLALEPGRESAALALVRLYVAMREPQKALELCDSTLKKSPDSLNALFLRAELAMRMNDRARAMGLYRRITEIAPRNKDARYMLGSLYINAGDKEKARATIASMREDMAGDARLFMLEGLQAYQERKYADAAGFFQNSVNSAPTIDGYYRLGLALHRVGNQESALSQLRKVLDLVPNHAASLKLMVAILMEQGRNAEARDEAGRLVEQYPDDPAARQLLGVALSAAGENVKALEELKKAAELDPGKPEALLKRGSILVTEGRYKEAGEELARAVAGNADNIDARRALFQFYLGRRNFTEAGAVVAEGLARQPGNAALLTMQAALLSSENRKGEALAAAEKARAADPNSPEALDMQLKLLIQDGQRGKALEICQEYLKRHPDSAPLLMAAAALLDMEGRREEASALLERAYGTGDKRALFILARRALDDKNPARAEELLKNDLAADPSAATRDFLCRVYLGAGKPEAALELYDSLEKSSPADAALGKFRLYMSTGKPVDALAEARRLETLDPSSPMGALCAAESLEKSGQPADALKELDQAYQRLRNTNLLLAMAELSLRRKDADKASAYYRTALRQEPGNARALTGQGNTLMMRGRYADAVSYYEQARQAAPGDAEINNNLAMAYAESGQNPEGALRMAVSAFMLSPNNPMVMDTLGLTLLRNGRADEAVSLLRDAVKSHPASAQLHYRLGTALLADGKEKEARDILRQSLELGAFAESGEARKLLEEKK